MDGKWRKNNADKTVLVILISMLFFAGAVYAQGPDKPMRGLPSKINMPCPGGSGVIWALHENGSNNDNFYRGENVYLGGQDFEINKGYSYELLDVDKVPNEALVDGNGTTDGSGNINIGPIWTIPSGDYAGHNYSVKIYVDEQKCGKGGMGGCCGGVVTKEDGFTIIVDDEKPPIGIPEFPAVAAIPVIMTLGGYLAMRVRRRR